jgi:hypothetical protein
VHHDCLHATTGWFHTCGRHAASPCSSTLQHHHVNMDTSIARALSDKVYDKRKSGALELEALIRSSLNAQDHERVAKIVHELCEDYAYAVHQPNARNGGLIGLAAASIALGPVRHSNLAHPDTDKDTG